MFDIQSKENQAQFFAAIELLKQELLSCFTEKEQKGSSLSLLRMCEGKEVDLLSEMDTEKLIFYMKYNNNINYRLVIKRDGGFIKKKTDIIEVAHFRLVEMPGCCGVVISTGAWTNDKFRRRGIGTALNKFRMAVAKAIGYSTMMCTAIDDGITERILGKNGWSKIGGFINRRTDNAISMYSVMLPK